MRAIACLLVLALTACSPDCQQIALKQWSSEEQRQMVDEIDALPDDSLLIAAMNDYAKLRREAR